MTLWAVLAVICSVDPINSQWITNSNSLPFENSEMAVGYHQNTIYLIGGYSGRSGQSDTSLILYDINSEEYSYNRSFFSTSFSSESQFWAQIGTKLYVRASSEAICIFHLDSRQMNCNWDAPPMSRRNDACIAISNDGQYLYNLGGQNYSTTFHTVVPIDLLQILNLSDGTWNITGPKMQEPRGMFSCIVSSNNALYAAGGVGFDFDQEDPEWLDTIEFISTTEIYTQSWEYVQGTFNLGFSQTRMIAHGNYVYIFGGYQDLTGDKASHLVYTINTVTNRLTVGLAPMANALEGKYNVAPIIVDGTIYVFGGNHFEGEISKDLQYYVLFTTAPSSNTDMPTSLPSTSPTYHPANITSSDTAMQTTAPTYTPSNHPSNVTSPETTMSSVLPLNVSSTYPAAINTLIHSTTTPTLCIDYKADYNSVDGRDEIMENTTINSKVLNDIQEYNNGTSYALTNTNIDCNIPESVICFIQCSDSDSCKDSVVSTQTDLVELKLICSGKGACAGLSVNVTSEIELLVISCSAILSCDGLTVIIESINDIEIVMECVDHLACKDSLMEMRHENDSLSIYANVTCFNDYSCNNLVIKADNSRNIFVDLNVYRWSEYIKINHHYHENVKVQCGSNSDHRYIQYNVRNNIPDPYEVLRLSRNEYPSTKRLPCENIEITCSISTDVPRSCQYKYALNVSLLDILGDELRPIVIGWIFNNYIYQNVWEHVRIYIFIMNIHKF